MELTIENLRTLSRSGQIFLTAHSQARLYERGILLADIRQAIQSGEIIEYRPDDYRCPSCLVLGVNLDSLAQYFEQGDPGPAGQDEAANDVRRVVR